MKTSLFISFTLLMLLVNLPAWAQFEFGLKGGGNFSQLTEDLSSDYRTGFHAGIFAEVKAKKIGIQPEVLFMTGGGESQQGLFNGDLKLDYIAVPVLVNIYPVSFLAIQFGPQFMYNTLAELTTTVGGNTSTRVLVDDLVEQRLWAGNVGLKVNLPLGFRISGRYVIGSTSLSKDSQVEGKQNFIMISLGKSLF
jgi:hypothetical protein